LLDKTSGLDNFLGVNNAISTFSSLTPVCMSHKLYLGTPGTQRDFQQHVHKDRCL